MDAKEKNWFKRHADTIAILGTFAFSFWTLNEKISLQNEKMTDKINVIDNRLTVIETVLRVKNPDICKNEEKK